MPEPREASLPGDLLRPEAFAAVAPTRGVTLLETHISWVLLLDHDVFKVKKPVDLGFLNFASPERRRRACENEVRYNRRLAPDVYRGVVPIGRDAEGRLSVGAGGAAVDWAVHMVRLPDEHRADRLLADGALDGELVDRIAAHIAAFHAHAPGGPAIEVFGRPAAITLNVEENFAQTGEALARAVGRADSGEITRWQTRFVRENAARFERRIAEGRVRDGHGDLRLEHVYVDRTGTIRVLDCIEFNDRFRYADVCADIGFLSTDLAAHGRTDLGERLLATYAREADDYGLYEVVDFYESYRAFVRGKVATMLASDLGAGAETRQRAQGEARRFFRLSLSFERPSLLPPSVVAVGGVIASGKSSIAARLGQAMSAPVLEADRTRKAMLEVSPYARIEDAPWQGAYDPAVGARVYEELFRRADVVLASGRPVVIDASFRSDDLRLRARNVAARRGVPFRFVECTAPRDICLARLERREQETRVSDGRRDIFDAFAARYEPAKAIAPGEHIVLDTTHPLEDSVERLRRELAFWPPGLRG